MQASLPYFISEFYEWLDCNIACGVDIVSTMAGGRHDLSGPECNGVRVRLSCLFSLTFVPTLAEDEISERMITFALVNIYCIQSL